MSLQRYPLVSLTLLATLLIAATAPAQEPPSEGPTATFGEEMEVTEVLLDVVVTDRNGQVVVGLRPDDFSVTEDGEPVELLDATFYSNRRLLTPAPAGIEVDASRSDRYFVFLFDDQRSANTDAPGLFNRQVEAGRAAVNWAEKGLLVDDWVAVATYRKKLILYQDFTRDRQAIMEALGEASRGARDPEQNWPSRLPEAGGDPALLTHLPTGDALRDETTRIYGAFEVLADASKHIRGRKNVLYFGTGFGSLDGFGQYRPERWFDPMVEKLNSANVAVYTIDVTRSGTRHAFSGALNQLANETGGRNFQTFSSFTTPISEVEKENNGYYLLSYRASHPQGEEGFQKVEVKVSNRDLQLRTRRGYLFGD